MSAIGHRPERFARMRHRLVQHRTGTIFHSWAVALVVGVDATRTRPTHGVRRLQAAWHGWSSALKNACASSTRHNGAQHPGMSVEISTAPCTAALANFANSP